MKTRLAAAALTAALLAACGGPSADEMLADAKSALARQDAKSATISLKAALQKSPDLAEARLLLGTTLLESGDAAGAAVELRKAQQLGQPDARVLPPLARALLASGEHVRVVQSWAETRLDDPQADADLRSSLAVAWLRLDKRDKATEAIDAALKARPEHVAARLLKARLLAADRDLDGALALLDRAVEQPGAQQAEAWVLKAQLLQYGRGDRDAALEAYRRAVAIDPKAMSAQQALVGLLIAGGRTAEAQAHVEALAKSLPDLAGTKLLQAQMAFLQGDHETTRRLTQPLVQAAPNNALLLQLAGANELRLGAFAQAETLLARAVDQAPGLPMATRLLAQIHLRNGNPDKALELLQPEIDAGRAGADTLLLAGQALLQTGDARRADAAFAQAAKLAPDDARARTALALGKIGRGDSAAGFDELEQLAASGDAINADMALIASRLRTGDRAGALKAVTALEAKRPKDAMPPTVRGRVLLAGGDRAGAAAAFERALAIDPGYFPAVASLAAIDLAAQKPDAARKRFEDVLAREPKNHRAMLALAELLERTGAGSDAVGARIAAAVQAAPTEVAPRVRLVEHRLQLRDTKGALEAAQAATAAIPSSRELLNALGRAELASGNHQQALTTFQKLAAAQPRSPLGLMGQAEAYAAMKDEAGVERSLRAALELAPALLPAQRALARVLVDSGRYDEAVTLARGAQKQRPAEAAGYLLEAQIEQARRKPDAALAALRTAVQKAPGSESAIALHAALREAGRGDEAERFAAGWQKQHADDSAFRFHLGDLAIAARDWPRAEARYREVLERQPRNALALNNVAWLMLQQGRKGALALAEQANAIAPGQPALRDTLALATAAEGQLSRALELQRETVQRAPDAPTLRLTLARLLLQSGDKAAARAELDKLAKLGNGFKEQAEVAELLKKT